jgi:C-terminal processing protease CtpA/Prc
MRRTGIYAGSRRRSRPADSVSLRFFVFAIVTSTAAISQQNLGFEDGPIAVRSPGWFAPAGIKGYTTNLSTDQPKAGKYCAELSWSGAADASPFGNIMQHFDATAYRGKRVRFRAAVRLAAGGSEADRAQMWFRVDRSQATGFFDNMDDRPIRAATWQTYEIVGDVEPDANYINIGLMFIGHGKVFFDDASVDILGDTPAPKTLPLPSGLRQQEAWDRLAAVAKLWVYVKYFHPGVTAEGVDWDQAFADAAPRVLVAANDADFEAAVDAMLAVLHDPSTHTLKPDASVRLTITDDKSGVKIVRVTPGEAQPAQEAADFLRKNLEGSGAVVFDLRDVRPGDSALPNALPVVVDSPRPPLKFRLHNGYAPQNGGGYQGYASRWETQNDAHPMIAAATPVRPVFLVNRRTRIPMVALAVQASGAGAIVSENELRDGAMAMGNRVQVGKIEVAVRTYAPAYTDGTTGLAANVILNKKGHEALQAAVEIARSGKWPAPSGRSKLELPPANYKEKRDTRAYPDGALRLLAAARIWGVFHYFHPYRYLYGEDWDSVLLDFLPKMAAAKSAREYHLAVAEMVSHTHDTHCFVSSGELSAFYGAPPPVEVRWIQGQAVVTRVGSEGRAAVDGELHPGDVLVKIDGQPVRSRLDELKPRIAASTPQSLVNRTMQLLLSGPTDSKVKLTLRGSNGAEHDATVTRSPANYPWLSHYRSGEVFRLMKPDVAYVDLARLKNEEVDAMFEKFKDTKTIIMDMRGYPNGTASSIAPRIAEESEAVAASFRTNVVRPDVEGGIKSEELFQRIPPAKGPRYRGKTILLIDERAISQSEHSGLFYRAANGTVFVGSATTGANGDITGFPVPGGINIAFSGHDVRWPDGRQLQRTGLHPDIEVAPTIEGIRSGRDEVLERAVRYAAEGK